MTQPITFPGLGLKFLIDPIAFSIFGMGIHWYGIIIATFSYKQIMQIQHWINNYPRKILGGLSASMMEQKLLVA